MIGDEKMNPPLLSPENKSNFFNLSKRMGSLNKHSSPRMVRDTSSTLKIGMITCWYSNISLENYSRNLKTNMEKKKGINVKVIASHCICQNKFPKNEEDALEECKFVSFPYIYRVYGLKILSSLAQSFLLLLRGINYLVKCRGCDVIHYQQSNFYSFGIMPLLSILLIPTGQKVVVTVHNFDKLQHKFRFLNRAYRNAHRIIVHSSSMKKDAEKLGIPRKKTTVIFHGSNVVPLTGSSRREITFFGAPVERKGFFVILRALRLLKESGHPLKLNIYGIYSREEKEKARETARKIGIDECLIWGGRLEEDEFDQKMQESLFTLAPYLTQISGSSVVTRAMANGTPLISTKVGGIPEYVHDAGLLIPPNRPQLLAEAMKLLFKNGELRESLGKKARERIVKLFSWDKISEEVLKIYRDIGSMT